MKGVSLAPVHPNLSSIMCHVAPGPSIQLPDQYFSCPVCSWLDGLVYEGILCQAPHSIEKHGHYSPLLVLKNLLLQPKHRSLKYIWTHFYSLLMANYSGLAITPPNETDQEYAGEWHAYCLQ